LSSRPPTPPCVPSGTRRFNELRVVPLTTCLSYSQAVTGNHFVHTVPFCAFQYTYARHSLSSLGFHPPLLRGAGSHRFLPSSRQSTFPPLPELPLFGPSRPVRSISQEVPLTVLWPLLTSCTSAIHYCIGSCTAGRVRQSPYKVDVRPPRVRASNLRPM
jgi:hypothetical protein